MNQQQHLQGLIRNSASASFTDVALVTITGHHPMNSMNTIQNQCEGPSSFIQPLADQTERTSLLAECFWNAWQYRMLFAMIGMLLPTVYQAILSAILLFGLLQELALRGHEKECKPFTVWRLPAKRIVQQFNLLRP